MTRNIARALWTIAVAMLSLPVTTADAQPVKFSPHRAVYDIQLARTGAASGVNELDGRLVYELKGSPCEGYEQAMRFVTRTSTQDGELQVTDLRTTSWEDAPAKRLRFTSRNYQNAKLSEETQGDARRPDTSSPAKVELVKPSRSESGLPANVYFPIQHSIAVLEAARSGSLMLSADLYDGSDSGRKIYNTSTVIGFEGKPGTFKFPALAENGRRLTAAASWPVSISYFEKKSGKGDAVPSYEMSYRFHENGVTSELTIDHGEFAFKGKLKELTFLPEATCPADKPQ